MAGGAGFKKLLEGLGSVKEAAGPVAGAGLNLGKGTAKTGGAVATGTAGVGAGIVGTALNTVGNFAQKHPKLTFLAVAYGAIKGIQAIVRKRRGSQEEAPAGQQQHAAPATVGVGAGVAEPTFVQGAGHQYSPGAPVMQAQPASHGPAGGAGQEPELTPAEQQAFIEALLAASQQAEHAQPKAAAPQQAAHAQAPGTDQGGWAQRVDASRQQPPQQQGR